MQNAFDFVHKNLQSSFQKQKRYYDTELNIRSFESQTLVICWYPPEANQKLGLGWTVPYEIISETIRYNLQNKKMKWRETKNSSCRPFKVT